MPRKSFLLFEMFVHCLNVLYQTQRYSSCHPAFHKPHDFVLNRRRDNEVRNGYGGAWCICHSKHVGEPSGETPAKCIYPYCFLTNSTLIWTNVELRSTSNSRYKHNIKHALQPNSVETFCMDWQQLCFDQPRSRWSWRASWMFRCTTCLWFEACGRRAWRSTSVGRGRSRSVWPKVHSRGETHTHY